MYKAILFFTVLIFVPSSRAEVIVDNLDQFTGGIGGNFWGPIGSHSSSSDFYIGQEFTLPTNANFYALDKITLLMNVTGGNVNISASIWHIGPDGNPTNQIAFVATQSVTNQGNVTFIPSNSIVLAGGSSNYVVVSPATIADSGSANWAFADSASTVWSGTGVLGNQADTYPGAWENFPEFTSPQIMRVEALALPLSLGIKSGQNSAVLSWPFTYSFKLQTTTNLTPPNWVAVTNTPVVIGGNHVVTNALSGSRRFFKLTQ